MGLLFGTLTIAYDLLELVKELLELEAPFFPHFLEVGNDLFFVNLLDQPLPKFGGKTSPFPLLIRPHCGCDS
jgi:hypothetical protein